MIILNLDSNTPKFGNFRELEIHYIFANKETMFTNYTSLGSLSWKGCTNIRNPVYVFSKKAELL